MINDDEEAVIDLIYEVKTKYREDDSTSTAA